MNLFERLRSTLLLLGLFACATAVAQDAEEEEEPAPQTIDELLLAINDVLEEHDTPGIAIAIVNEGRTRADDLATLKVGGDCAEVLDLAVAPLAA